MMETARQTSLNMREAERAAWRSRLSDPLEMAKVALQRAGQQVFSHSLLAPGSTLIVVGNRTMQPDAVIQHAERHGRW